MSKSRTHWRDQPGPARARRRWWWLAWKIVGSLLLGTVTIPTNLLIVILITGGYNSLHRFISHSLDFLLNIMVHGGLALLPVVLIMALIDALFREEHPLRRLGWGLFSGGLLVYGSFLLWAATLYQDEYDMLLNHPVGYIYILIMVSPAGAVAFAVFYLVRKLRKADVSRRQLNPSPSQAAEPPS